jgi:hypothetical protein
VKILLATPLKVVGVPFDLIRQALKLPRVEPALPRPADPTPTLESATA